MSLNVGKKLVQLCSGVWKSQRSMSTSVAGILRCNRLISPLQTQSPFARTMWSMCSRAPTGLSALEARQVASTARWNKTCGCCGIHTQGDQELIEFLGEEIDHEKKTATTSLPKIKGFDVSSDGSALVLTKEIDGEKITIEMNINHSVQDAATAEYEGKPEGQENAAEMVVHPPFTVKFNKGGDLTLALQCDFPEHESYQPAAEGQEDYEDAIEITEVAMLKGEWEDKVYAVSGSVMDGNLYDMLMNMMEERGITGECIDQIVEYATCYDQHKYIKFLEELRSFTNTK